MLQIPNQPSLTIDEFQKRIRNRRSKLHEIDQIASFNQKKGKPQQQLPSKQFDEASWEVLSSQAQKHKQNFFEEEGKQLLGTSKSQKTIGKNLLLLGTLIHMFDEIINYYISAPTGWIALQVLIITVYAIFIINTIKLKGITSLQKYKKYLNKWFDYCLICSMLLSFVQIMVSFGNLTLLQLSKVFCLILSLLAQCKIRKKMRYIVWMENQINKQIAKQQIQNVELQDQIG